MRLAVVTPDEWTTGRLNDLAAQVRTVASVVTLVATHDAKIDGHDDDIKALRENQREAVARMERLMEAVGKTCEEHAARVERKIDKQAEKIDQQAKDRQWTPMVKVAILGPTTASLISAVALVVSKGS